MPSNYQVSVSLGCLTDGQVDFSSGGSGSPSNSISSPGVSMPPGGLFGQSQQPAAFPHLKGEDEPSENITSMNEKMYEGIDCSELVEQLKDTDTLHEQADIIHYLYTTKYVLVCCITSAVLPHRGSLVWCPGFVAWPSVVFVAYGCFGLLSCVFSLS